jgi:hypothetical protein
MLRRKRSASSSLRYSFSGASLRAGAGRRMSAAAQDAALAAMWAAADRRRIGWILGYLRKGIVHRDYRDYAGLLPEGSARGLLTQFCSVRARAGGCARRSTSSRTPPPVDDAREGPLRWMALRDIRWCREWLLPHEKRLSTSKQYRLISERQNPVSR